MVARSSASLVGLVASLLASTADTFAHPKPPHGGHHGMAASQASQPRWLVDRVALYELQRLSVVRYSSNNRDVLDELTREFDSGLGTFGHTHGHPQSYPLYDGPYHLEDGLATDHDHDDGDDHWSGDQDQDHNNGHGRGHGQLRSRHRVDDGHELHHELGHEQREELERGDELQDFVREDAMNCLATDECSVDDVLVVAGKGRRREGRWLGAGMAAASEDPAIVAAAAAAQRAREKEEDALLPQEPLNWDEFRAAPLSDMLSAPEIEKGAEGTGRGKNPPKMSGRVGGNGGGVGAGGRTAVKKRSAERSGSKPATKGRRDAGLKAGAKRRTGAKAKTAAPTAATGGTTAGLDAAKRNKARTKAAAKTTPKAARPVFTESESAEADERRAKEIPLCLAIQTERNFTDTRFELAKQLGRQPSNEEWTAAVGLEPGQLFKRVLEGRRAKGELVAMNSGLVRSICRKYTYALTEAGFQESDLVQEGTMGLIRAAEKFDTTRGNRFSTYASTWIRATVLNYLKRTRIIHVPEEVQWLGNKIRAIEKASLNEEGVPTISEEQIAERLTVTVKKVRAAKKALGSQVMSYDAQATEDKTYLDRMGSDQAELLNDQVSQVRDRRWIAHSHSDFHHS
mmetsp:Transcript_24704/g.66591  ORF Transcript_24704/g.66591 Transcript_24704/m.66591 type:complete len:627 (+) Transcript_24704:167-2047(+)